jgi:hypothetical protein
MGTIALSNFLFNPYNMHMKNTKAVFLIILGSFLLATGFAYAKEDGPAMQDLKAWVNDSQSVVVMDAAGVKDMGNLNKTKSASANVKAAIDNTVKASTATAAGTTVSKPEEPKPSLMDKFKEFWGKKGGSSMIISALAIGFLGFLILGTAGAGLLVGAAAFGALYALNNL